MRSGCTKRPPPTGRDAAAPADGLSRGSGCGWRGVRRNGSGASSGAWVATVPVAPHSQRRASSMATSRHRTTWGILGWSGRTLYLFEKDQPNQSACAGACAAAWPVDQTSGTPKAGSGVMASLLGTTKRADGSTQVTYNQHPLYYFQGDSEAGQHNGQGVDAFGAKWFVVGPAGGAVSSGANAATPANGGGYGSSNGSGSGFGGY